MLRTDISPLGRAILVGFWRTHPPVVRRETKGTMATGSGNLENPELTLPQGRIQGARRQTIYDQIYYSFEGIPFAKAPLGELRFRAPQPAEPWIGTRDATQCANKPTQWNALTGVWEGSEDCLYLNVYAQTLKSAEPLPVMVFIYGGSFHMGEATRELYSPDYLMRAPIVLVTFNYRLCSLGFLSLKDPQLNVPGNAGLKDQVQALKWVKDNIEYFNGDSNNITVFGESAGGASTHYMMLSEQTRGLFQRAIPMSGCALNHWAHMEQSNMAYRLAAYHGYEGDNIDADVLAFLQQLSPQQLVKHALLTEEDRRHNVMFAFGPIVEPYVGADCVVPQHPFDMLKTAWSNEIPMMFGGSSFEGLVMYPHLKMFPQIMKAIINDPARLVPQPIRALHTPEESADMGKKLMQLFFGDREPNDRSMFKFLHIFSYTIFWHDFHRTILARLAYAAAPTYLYRFDFDSPDFNHYRTKLCGHDAVRGVAHADDLSYLFFSKDAWKVTPDSAEFKTIQRMVGIWTAFATNSNPNCAEIHPTVWKPLQASDPNVALNISDDVEIMELPEKGKLDVWDSLYACKEQLY